ncbi:MAG: aminotransferase class I/II-fold pyridoxal phosphate-dependent enzyme [Phycisphaerae bacterium]|nr:aminotransferase class I/II-fold pyridoxal phosphate-dependent enzyme [Phycisphaerae bacterium]
MAEREMVNFAGNDYLGLARHPEVVEALCRGAERYGISSTSSRWALGWTDIHARLESDLASFMKTEAAGICGASYLGGAIYYGRMAARGFRTVFCDEMVHSNQYLGMRAAGFEIRRFKHLDATDLRRLLAEYSGRPAIVATDGVYGISGEIAPLAEFVAAARTVKAEVFVDDAHGVGAIGETGRGIVELAGVDPNEVTVLGSMSKAMGTNGGFLAGRLELVETFRRSPEASGSAIPPPPIAAAAVKALELVRTRPELRAKANANAAKMRLILAAAGIGLVCDRHPIVAMLLKDEFEAAALDKHFLTFGLRIPYFKYASEPRENLLRAAARAIYTDEHLERFAQAVRSRPGK